MLTFASALLSLCAYAFSLLQQAGDSPGCRSSIEVAMERSPDLIAGQSLRDQQYTVYFVVHDSWIATIVFAALFVCSSLWSVVAFWKRIAALFSSSATPLPATASPSAANDAPLVADSRFADL